MRALPSFLKQEAANVRYSRQGFCGTGCQKGYGGCGSVEEPSCSGQSMARTIGYYEGWYAEAQFYGYTRPSLMGETQQVIDAKMRQASTVGHRYSVLDTRQFW